MSHSDEPSGSSKPVVKDKNPHNYRKVGYTMIVISVSLVLIGLLVWAIGDNYHFSSDIMADQEIDSMTPKHGFNIVYYDTAQPVGAKLKLLDSAGAIDEAQQKQMQFATQNPSINGKVVIFNSTLTSNQKLVKDTIAIIVEAQAAQAQAAKDQAAKILAAQAANATMSKQETVVSARGNVTVSPVKNQNQSNPTITPVTSPAVVNGTNQTQSATSTNQTQSVTQGITVGQMRVNATMMPVNKTINLSEKIGINASGK